MKFNQTLQLVLILALGVASIRGCTLSNDLQFHKRALKAAKSETGILERRWLADSTELIKIQAVVAEKDVIIALGRADAYKMTEELEYLYRELDRMDIEPRDVIAVSNVKIEYRDTGRTQIVIDTLFMEGEAPQIERTLFFEHDVVPETIKIRGSEAFRDFKINPIGITFAVTEERRLIKPNLLSVSAATDTKGISFSQGTGLIRKIPKPKWSLGISAGYGVSLNRDGEVILVPYIGFAIHKPIIQW